MKIEPVLKYIGRTGRAPQKLRRSSAQSLDQPEWIIPAASSRIPKIIDTSEDTSRESVILSNGKCTRYCIANGIDRDGSDFQYINIFWSGNVTSESSAVVKGHSQLAMPDARWTDEQNADNVPRKCQMYLDLDCGTAETETSANSMRTKVFSTVQNAEENEGEADGPAFETLVNVARRRDLTGETETKFLVDNEVDRIVMNVEGNVSGAVLRIPMNVTVPWLGTVVSWTRKGQTDGVRIDTNNAPPGEWWMKLLGEDNSKYHFTADGFARTKHAETTEELLVPRLSGTMNKSSFMKHRPNTKENDVRKLDGSTSNDDLAKVFYSRIRTLEEQNSDLRIDPNTDNDEKLMRERSLEQNNETTPENFNENDTSIFSIPRNVNFVEYVNFADDGNVTASRNNHSVSFVEELPTFIQEQHGINARSSIPLSENIDGDIKRKIDNSDLPMKMVETSENQELLEELVNYSNENTIQEKRMLIEVNRNSNLIAAPGSIHRIVFDVMNTCILPVRYGFRVKSTPFRVYNVVPTYAWIYPGQMSQVAVDIVVPDNTSPDTANTVTLYIQGTEIKEKSAYIYVQGSLSKLTDDVKPKVEYSFNNNCAGKLDKSQCYKTRWSMDLTIQDYDSGLKRVISSSNEVYPRTEFISGTRNPVIFFYSATCCDTTTKITAVDLLNNYNTVTINVTEWNNLSEAQVAAISVGALLIVLFIILIIVLIICCVRRRKSLDLPYSQRYGSRPPAQAERTNL
ncbi:uncharacterized protein LOC143362528 [Halictus rubicundus]|uniref:uncharacterized protein LOC143362528 n=1 Tax=Halictus rubicundus TaxID=77578 RepID=UPI004036EB9C